MRTSDIKRLGEAWTSVTSINEAKIRLDDHDIDDKGFQSLIKKLSLKAKPAGDYDTDVSGAPANSEKMLQSMFGNDWKDMYKRKGQNYVSEQVGYTDEEIRELCHSKDHNCAVTVIHPEWGKGKPVYESHAIPDDEGNVEWYDVQFKHGLEKKVPASDMEVIEESSHMGSKKKKTEGNAFTGALKAAKEKGEKTFTVAGKTYDVKTEEARLAKEDNTNDKSDDGEGLDKVQPKAIKKKFADRKDKDIDNDGDVDDSDEYLHNRRKAVSKSIAKEAEHGDDENGEDKPDTANGDDEKKKKKNGNPKTDDKTAEISKIGEAVDELNSMFERLWEAEHSGKRKQDQNNGEPYDDKESPKSKEFENAHKKSDKKIEDNYDDGVAKTTKTEKDGTKAKSGKRPQDNQAGDNNVVNPVKEDFDMDAKEGSISMVELARRQLAGEGKHKEKGENKEVKENPFDGRTKAAREFLERMNKRRGN